MRIRSRAKCLAGQRLGNRSDAATVICTSSKLNSCLFYARCCANKEFFCAFGVFFTLRSHDHDVKHLENNAIGTPKFSECTL